MDAAHAGRSARCVKCNSMLRIPRQIQAPPVTEPTRAQSVSVNSAEYGHLANASQVGQLEQSGVANGSKPTGPLSQGKQLDPDQSAQNTLQDVVVNLQNLPTYIQITFTALVCTVFGLLLGMIVSNRSSESVGKTQLNPPVESIDNASSQHTGEVPLDEPIVVAPLNQEFDPAVAEGRVVPSEPERASDRDEPDDEEELKPYPYQMGSIISVGYTGYSVQAASWVKKISDNPYLNETPNANFLSVRLWVHNLDNKARQIPPVKLIDENGAEYTARTLFGIPDTISSLDTLNPGVDKSGTIIFDVPKRHTYKLRLSGGFWSGQHRDVELEIR